MKISNPTKTKGVAGLIINTVLIVGAVAGTGIAIDKIAKGFGFAGFLSSTGADTSTLIQASGGTGQAVVIDDNANDQATLSLNAYDREASSETIVSTVPVGIYKILNANGDLSKLNDRDSTNFTGSITTASVGQQLFLAGGDGSYYMDAIPVYDVSIATDTINGDVHAIAGESSMTVTVKDDSGTVLTADDDAENTADYSLSMGAGEEKLINVELKVSASNKAYQLKAVAVGFNNDADNIEVANSDWTKVTLPKELSDASITHTNDTSSTFTTDYDTFYVYKAGTNEVIDLAQWEKYSLPFVVTADSSTDPTANTGDVINGLFLDGAWAEGKDGFMSFDVYQHDSNEGVGAVGLDETVTSPEGLQIGFVVELQ